MKPRVIVIFPECEGLEEIEALRRQYDPLAELVPAHITLVFPFQADLTPDELSAHIREAIGDMPPFRVRLQGVTGQDGEYLFLNVKEGNDRLIELHDRLYAGSLTGSLCREHTFVPHLTVGRFPDRERFLEAVAETERFTWEFEVVVREVTAYRVEEAGARAIESRVSLMQQARS